MADESTGGTAVKRIQLRVESTAPSLGGIDSTISRMSLLSGQIGKVNAGLLQMNVLFGARTSGGISSGTSQTIKQMSQMGLTAKGMAAQVNQAMKDLGTFSGRMSESAQGITVFSGGNQSKILKDIQKRGNKTQTITERLKLDPGTGDWQKVSQTTHVQEKFVDDEYKNALKTLHARQSEQEAFRKEALARNQALTASGKANEAQSYQDALKGLWNRQKVQEAEKNVDKENRKLFEARARDYGQQVQAARIARTNERHDRFGRDETFEERLQRVRSSGGDIQSKVDNAYRAQIKENNAENKPSGKGGFGFAAGMSLAQKVGTAATWYAAYTGIHKVADTIVYSYQRMEELQLQTARLTQVFRGQGGTAKQLTDDVLKLAAAEGRGSEEATASAIAWSRLGLSRRQVSELTRVSMMAANVAEISAGDATQHLSSIMAGFNVEASQMGAVLGMLNQSSNTYRVTTAELLQGLSRVSGIARGSGMSLAELQGILAVSVQKTGQTGANMANALKTGLSRMNRPDVGDFFAKRYDLKMTGSASDLEKIYAIYTKVNDEQRRDIVLKLSGATQSNRMKAILDSYPESLKAATESLLNLNSAEKENALVTNTAAAARERLKTTWDRFVNSERVEQAASMWLNRGAGTIAGLTAEGGPSKRERIFFRPEDATTRGSLGQIGNMMSFGIGRQARRLAFGGAYWLKGGRHTYDEGLNAADESWDEQLGISRKPQTMADWFQVFQDDINKRSGKSQAFSIRSRFLKELAGNYGSMRPEDRESNLKALKGQVSDDAVAKLRAGDTSGISTAADDYQKQSRLEHDKVTILQTRKMQDLKDERPAANAERQKEIDSEILEIEGKTLDEQRKYNDELESGRDSILDMVRAMEAQKELTKEIASVFKGIGLSEYSQKLIELRYQLSLNEALMNQAKDPEIRDSLEKESDRLRAQLDVAKSPLAKSIDTVNRNASIATQFAGDEVESQGIGLSQGEKLLDRRKFIQQELAKYTDMSKMSTNDLLRANVLLTAQKATELSVSQRILENEKERKQTMIETQREFQKSLIGAGPGELLRKLAEAQLAGKSGSRIRTAGQFFSLTGESQRDVYSLMGGEQMASLNAEARALRGRGSSVAGLQRDANATDTRIGKYGSEYGRRIIGDNGVPATVYHQAAQAITLATGAANALAAAFDRLRLKVIQSGANASTGAAAAANSAPSATPVSQASNRTMYDMQPVPASELRDYKEVYYGPR